MGKIHAEVIIACAILLDQQKAVGAKIKSELCVNMKYRLYLLSGITAFLAACDQDDCDFSKILIPSYAENIVEICMQDIASTQINYSVNVEYEDVSVINFYENQYSQDKWAKCDSNSRWLSYEKNVEEGLQKINSKTVFFVNELDEEILTVNLSHDLSNEKRSAQYINQKYVVQNVIVILNQLPKNTFDKHLNALEIYCE